MPARLAKLSPEPWLLRHDRYEPSNLAKYETLFTLANGQVGLRGSLETNPLDARAGLYLAGVFDRVGGHAHEIVNLPCPLRLQANMDGFDLDLEQGTVLEYQRTLDMRQGLLYTNILWKDGAKRRTRWETWRMVHAEHKGLAVIWGRITPLDTSGRLSLASTLDAWATKYASDSGQNHYKDIAVSDLGEAGIGLSLTMKDSGLDVAEASVIELAGKDRRNCTLHDDKITEQLSAPMTRGKGLSFVKWVYTASSRHCEDPAAEAVSQLDKLRSEGVNALCKQHVRWWKQTWETADVVVGGDARAQKALRFNTFHLAQLAAPGDEGVSLGAKGLHGNGYRGLVFWDTEIYLVPFYTFVEPEAARALLSYRYHLLDECRQNAAKVDRRGARFPWNSSITALENAWDGWQDHVGSDVAYAADQYVTATGDWEWYLDRGAEMIIAAGRYWLDRAEFDPDRQQYMIPNICGPDEIHAGIDNNAYNNYLVQWNLDRALQAVEDLREAGRWKPLAKRLGIDEAELEAWADVRDRICIPWSDEKGFHEQFEGYFKYPEGSIDRKMTQKEYTGPVMHALKPTKVSKQADTVLIYQLFPDAFSQTAAKKACKYYEDRCTHASSLSRSGYAIVAARTGLTAKAYKLFLTAAELDYGELSECDSGIHAASLGGTWQAAVMGFAGFSIRDGRPAFAPHLPKPWKSLAFTIMWKGRPLSVKVTPATVTLKTRSGKVQAWVGDQQVEVTSRAKALKTAKNKKQTKPHDA